MSFMPFIPAADFVDTAMLASRRTRTVLGVVAAASWATGNECLAAADERGTATGDCMAAEVTRHARLGRCTMMNEPGSKSLRMTKPSWYLYKAGRRERMYIWCIATTWEFEGFTGSS